MWKKRKGDRGTITIGRERDRERESSIRCALLNKTNSISQYYSASKCEMRVYCSLETAYILSNDARKKVSFLFPCIFRTGFLRFFFFWKAKWYITFCLVFFSSVKSFIFNFSIGRMIVVGNPSWNLHTNKSYKFCFLLVKLFLCWFLVSLLPLAMG